MPHVSFNKLDDQKRKELYREFVKSLERAFKSEKSFAVLQEFLTHTEREMFAKRFAVIALLKKSVPVSKIATVLKMSRVTIDTMAIKYESGKYDRLIASALKEKSIFDILDSIGENLDTAGGMLPPYVGRGRWKNFKKK
ncbi:MAG: Trp family transcriptional regulator [bacterium]|nr:Trp family transcriptional regulator [bacterium]